MFVVSTNITKYSRIKILISNLLGDMRRNNFINIVNNIELIESVLK